MPKNKGFNLPPTYAETKEREAVRQWRLKGKTSATLIAARKAKSRILKELEATRSKSDRDDATVKLWEQGKITSQEMFKRMEDKK